MGVIFMEYSSGFVNDDSFIFIRNHISKEKIHEIWSQTPCVQILA